MSYYSPFTGPFTPVPIPTEVIVQVPDVDNDVEIGRPTKRYKTIYVTDVKSTDVETDNLDVTDVAVSGTLTLGGTPIDSTYVRVDGSSTMIGPLDMGGYAITHVGAIVTEALGVAIGNGITSSGDHNVIAGDSVQANAERNTVIGSDVRQDSAQSVTIGTDVNSNSSDSVVIGIDLKQDGNHNVTIGSDLKQDGTHNVTIGTGVDCTAANSVIIGNTVGASNGSNVVIGHGTALGAAAVDSIAIGKNNTVDDSVDEIFIVGRQNSASAGANSMTALGWHNTAGADHTIAVGGDAVLNGAYNISIGHNNQTSGLFSFCMGANLVASASNAICIGNDTTNSTANSVLFGNTDTVNIRTPSPNCSLGTLPEPFSVAYLGAIDAPSASLSIGTSQATSVILAQSGVDTTVSGELFTQQPLASWYWTGSANPSFTSGQGMVIDLSGVNPSFEIGFAVDTGTGATTYTSSPNRALLAKAKITYTMPAVVSPYPVEFYLAVNPGATPSPSASQAVDLQTATTANTGTDVTVEVGDLIALNSSQIVRICARLGNTTSSLTITRVSFCIASQFN